MSDLLSNGLWSLKVIIIIFLLNRETILLVLVLVVVRKQGLFGLPFQLILEMTRLRMGQFLDILPQVVIVLCLTPFSKLRILEFLHFLVEIVSLDK